MIVSNAKFYRSLLFGASLGLAAGSAGATQIIDGSFADYGSGELFLSVYDETNGRSGTVNLAVTYDAFVAGASGSTWDLAGFLTDLNFSASDILTYNIFAAKTYGAVGTADAPNPDYGMLVSRLTGDQTPNKELSNQNIVVLTDKVQLRIGGVNGNLDPLGPWTGAYEISAAADLGSHWATTTGVQPWMTGVSGNQVYFYTDALAGSGHNETLDIYWLHIGTTGITRNNVMTGTAGQEKLAGTFTLDPAAATLTYSGGGGGGTATPVLGTIEAFADQTVGSTSAAKTVTLGNTGTAAYVIQSIAADGDFAATHDCNGSVAASGSCNIQVTFSPTAAGARTGTLTVTPATGTPLTLALSGTGTAATGVVLGTIEAFGDQAVGSTSAAKTVTLSNTGTAAYAIQSIAADGNFAATDDCNGSVAASGSCNIQVIFSPTAAGARTGTLTVTPATGTPLTLALSSIGTAATGEVVLGTLEAFASQTVGSTSSAKTVTLTNNGTTAYAIQSIAASGDFALTHDCGTSLAGGANCLIQVNFTPVLAGARSGKLAVTPGTGDALNLDLSGTGVIPANLAVSPTRLDFGAVTAGKRAKLAVTLRNTGTGNLTVGSVADPEAPFAKGKDGCSNKVLTPGKSCSVGYQFAPTAEGPASATSTIAADGIDPVVVSLSGNGGSIGAVAVDPAPTQDIGLGGSFSVTGQGFSTRAGKLLVNGKRAKIVTWTDTLIIAKAPRLVAGTYDVQLTRKGGQGSGTGLVTVHGPAVDSAGILNGSGGSLAVELIGQYFGASKPTVIFKSTSGRKTRVAVGDHSETTLQLKLPKRLKAGDYEITVQNFAGISAAVNLTVE